MSRRPLSLTGRGRESVSAAVVPPGGADGAGHCALTRRLSPPTATPDEIRRVWIAATVDLLKALVFAAGCIGFWYAALVILIGVR